MKVLYLTKYSRMAGSSRLRSFQYFPYLEKKGIKVKVHSFFDDEYLKDLYAGKRNLMAVLKSYARRFFVLFTVFKYDVIVIEKEIFPYFPAWAEYLLQLIGKKYIVDYDDAIFHNYDQSKNIFIRKFLGKKIDKVMKYASIVVAGNSYLAERAEKSGAKQIEIIPTVTDINRYPVKSYSKIEKFIVGWIGTKSTFEKHLYPCKEWILEAQKIDDVEFHIIGITEDQGLGNKVKYIPWKEDSEVENIHQFDVGIMPLEDSVWERGKCSYKIIQYFSCGIPSIASPVGMNKEVIEEGVNGFLAATPQEWLSKIQFLKNNKEETIRLGTAARKKIEENYCIQITAKQWFEIFNKVYGFN